MPIHFDKSTTVDKLHVGHGMAWFRFWNAWAIAYYSMASSLRWTGELKVFFLILLIPTNIEINLCLFVFVLFPHLPGGDVIYWYARLCLDIGVCHWCSLCLHLGSLCCLLWESPRAQNSKYKNPHQTRQGNNTCSFFVVNFTMNKSRTKWWFG